MGSPTLQTHQDPILLLPWLWSRVGGPKPYPLGVLPRLTRVSEHQILLNPKPKLLWH
jgi:hypothetical protein